ncbi:MAG: hypothetical protein JOZ41_20900 [Chloroflexi bacterium]|nr:hypothetical protein [Chloroflexota bacterium]
MAEHMGKYRRATPPDRFARLIPEVLAVLRAAWSPEGANPVPQASEEQTP